MIREYIIKYDDDEKKKDIHGGYPLIERIELIRCKDCYNKECTWRDGVRIVCGIDGDIHPPEWFCAHGQKK